MTFPAHLVAPGRPGAFGATSMRIADPHDLFRAGQAGAWWSYSSPSLLFTTSTTGGAAPTNGQAISLAIGSRAENPLAAGLGSEFVTNGGPVFSDTSGWVPSGTGASLSVIASNLAITNGAAVQAAGLWDLATAAGVLYKFTAALIDRSDGAAAQARVVEVGGGSAALCLVTAAEGGGANTQYFVAVSSTSRIQLFTGSGSLGVVSQWNSISTRAIPGYAARQGTAALKPIWRSAFGGYADHDESDDVLPQTYPAAFTGDIMLLKPDGSILEWTGQNITTTFNPPGVDQKELVVRSTMQVREKQALAAWMRGRPLA